MSGHTPGPWTKDNCGNLVGSNGDKVLIADSGIGFASGSGRPERYANARLIGSAPMLLLSNERLLGNFRLLLSGKPVRDVEETIAEAEQAIAAATGEPK